jgi:hypothetical protein
VSERAREGEMDKSVIAPMGHPYDVAKVHPLRGARGAMRIFPPPPRAPSEVASKFRMASLICTIIAVRRYRRLGKFVAVIKE